MPGVGTHTTIIQRLAREARDDPAAGDLRTFLTDPDLSAVKGEYKSLMERDAPAINARSAAR